MAFCKYCGNPIAEGGQCTCAEAAAEANDQILGAAPAVIPPVQSNPAPQQFGAQQFGAQQFGAQNTPAEFMQPQPPAPAAAAANPNKKKGIIIAAAAVLLAVIGVLVWFLFLRGESEPEVADYEQPVSQLFNGINQKDGRLCMESMATDHWKNYKTEYRYDGDKSRFNDYYDDLCDRMTENLEEFFEEAADGWNVEKIKYSYRITGKTRLDEYELRDFEDEDLYESDELTAGYELKVKMTVKGDDRSESSNGTLKVVKCSEGWKLVPESNQGFRFSRFDDAEDVLSMIMR